jgi:hypothetical protein
MQESAAFGSSVSVNLDHVIVRRCLADATSYKVVVLVVGEPCGQIGA